MKKKKKRLLDFENAQLPGTWNEETIKELKEYHPPEGTGTAHDDEPNPYYFWRGSRLPGWFE